jgi:hypothetical protein
MKTIDQLIEAALEESGAWYTKGKLQYDDIAKDFPDFDKEFLGRLASQMHKWEQEDKGLTVYGQVWGSDSYPGKLLIELSFGGGEDFKNKSGQPVAIVGGLFITHKDGKAHIAVDGDKMDIVATRSYSKPASTAKDLVDILIKDSEKANLHKLRSSAVKLFARLSKLPADKNVFSYRG